MLGGLFAVGFTGGAGSVVALMQFGHAWTKGAEADSPAAAFDVPGGVTRLQAPVDVAPSSALTVAARTAPVALAVPLPSVSDQARHSLTAQSAKAKAEPPAFAEQDPDPSVPVVVRRGDTLMQILLANGIEPTDAHAAITALQTVYDPRRLRTGQEITITPSAATGPRRLSELSFSLGPLQAIEVLRDDAGAFQTRKVDRPKRRVLIHEDATIRDSLYLTASRADVPPQVTAELIKLFSWDVDFQRDIHPGNTLELLFEQVIVEDNETAVVPGDILHARLELNGRTVDAYRFEQADGTVNYFDHSGRSLKKSLLRTPVDGARVSSRFGMRKHPILGYSRMHKGVDFAAPVGTPIFAAGRGRIEVAGRNGGYGNYVRIKHNGAYGTAYAHMSRIADGIRPGREVRQGQIIGYVGSTGRSTGPHLHYEILHNGEQVNPLKVRQAALEQLTGRQLASFEREVARIDRIRAQSLTQETQLAARLD